jgi:hypothetical protein
MFQSMNHNEDYEDVPLSNLFVPLSVLSDLPVAYCSRYDDVYETAGLNGREAEWLSAATHLGIFRSRFVSGGSQRPELRIDIAFTTPAGDIIDEETVTNGLFRRRAAELADSSKSKAVRETAVEIPNVALHSLDKNAEVSIREKTSEYVHAVRKTRSVDRDVRHRRLPLGVLSVDTHLQRDDEAESSTVVEEGPNDGTIEPLDLSNVDTAEIGETVIDRLTSTHQSHEPRDVVFRGGDTDTRSAVTPNKPQTFVDLGLTDSGSSRIPFKTETISVSIRRTDKIQPVAEDQDELPSHVARINIQFNNTNALVLPATAEATVWIPLLDSDKTTYSSTALADVVTNHARQEYRGFAYLANFHDFQWHVWDPEEHAYVDASSPADADNDIARTHERADGERLICPVTDTGTFGIARVRPCEIGVIEVSCMARLYHPIFNRVLRPIRRVQQKLHSPFWTDFERDSGQLVNRIAERTDGLGTGPLRLARRV